jgi:hypothetical protein
MYSYKQFLNNHFFDQRLARIIGFGALAPFLLLSLACWVVHPGWLGDVIRGQLSYGIAILSFLGGIHWTGALVTSDMSGEQTKKVMMFGVAPAAVSWFAVLIDAGLGFAISMICFIAAYRFDRRMYPIYHLPEWLLKLRYQMTCATVGAQLLTFIAVNLRA